MAAVLPTSRDKSRLSGDTMWWTSAFRNGKRRLRGENSTEILRSTISAGDVKRDDADDVYNGKNGDDDDDDGSDDVGKAHVVSPSS